MDENNLNNNDPQNGWNNNDPQNGWNNGPRDDGTPGGNNRMNMEGGEGKGLSIASMVCGILSLLCCCGGWFGLVLSVVALIFGIVSVKGGYGGKEMAIAGIITGGCGLALCVAIMIITTVFSGYNGRFIEDIIESYDINGITDSL